MCVCVYVCVCLHSYQYGIHYWTGVFEKRDLYTKCVGHLNDKLENKRLKTLLVSGLTHSQACTLVPAGHAWCVPLTWYEKRAHRQLKCEP